MDPRHLACTRLISACARNRSDDLLWCEFLRRYGPRIKRFVRGTCASWSAKTGRYSDILPRAIQESDLFQTVIVRLVEDECAVMRAFSGANEGQWLTYLAVITRSVVCDLLRCQGRPKRSGRATPLAKAWWGAQIHRGNQHLEIEKGVVAGELRTICERTIRNLAGERADRDIPIFDLYFFRDPSISQIAACRGVDLSRAAVGKVLHRLRRRVQSVIDEELPQIAKSRPERGKIVNIDERRGKKFWSKDGVTYRERADALHSSASEVASAVHQLQD
jgi:DNA-directed RNA polymerase specialized sigma24 family protein